MLSLLRLNGVQLEQLSIKTLPVGEDRAAEEVYSVTLTHSTLPPKTAQSETRMSLAVRVRPAKGTDPVHSYSDITITLTGRFSLDERITDDVADKIYPQTAVAMLFGIARGIVAQTTGLCPSGTFWFPPLDVTAAATRKRLSGDCILRRSVGAVTQDAGIAIEQKKAIPSQ